MTTSTPPAWHWRDECYVPNAGTDHEYGQMREEALSMDARNLPDTATLHAQNDSGTEPEVSSSTTRKLEPDPTGEDVWPLERAVSTTASSTFCVDQCDCPCPPSVAHNAECDRTAQVADAAINAAPSHRVGTCYLDPDTGETVMPADFFGEKELRWRTDEDGNRHHSEPIVTDNPFLHEMMDKAEGCAADKLGGVHVAKCPVCLHELENDEGVLCDHCELPTGLESFAVVYGHSGVFIYHLACYDEVYWAAQGIGHGHRAGQEFDDAEETPLQTLDTLDPTLDAEEETPLWHPAEVADKVADSVPFRVQEFLFESLAEEMVAQLPHLIFTHSERIVEMARDRFRKGYAKYGSAAYEWDAETRMTNVLEELADAVVYLTSGPIE